MTIQSFHSLNLDHETGEFEEVIVIKVLRVRKWAILDLNEDFIYQSIVSVIKHIIYIILHDIKEFSIAILKCSLINN